MKEIEDVFGSKDLPMKVKYSCDTNPIYDTLAANELTSSLNASNVTYHSFRNTLKRQKNLQKNLNQPKNVKKKLPKAQSQPQVIPPPVPPSATSSSMSPPPLPSSPHDYQNSSELLSLLMKDISPQASPTGVEPSEPRKEKPRKKTPSPPLMVKARSVGALLGAGNSKPGEKPVLSAKPTPSYGYSKLEHFQNKPTVPPHQPSPEPNRNGSTSDDDEHEYAEVDQNPPPRKTKLTKKLSDFEMAGWVSVQNGSSTPPPIPPLRGSEWEGKKLGPPKPPRARQRWEKKVEKGSEGRGHKAVKNTDVLRVSKNLNTLMLLIAIDVFTTQ